MGLAVIAMIVVAVILLIAVPVLMRVFSDAVDRHPDRSDGNGETGSEEESQGGRSDL